MCKMMIGLIKQPVVSVILAAGIAAGAQAGEQPPTSQDLVYRYDEMFNFNIEAWLAEHAPHLSPQAETISHWAGYTGISPRALITLMELQSGAVSNTRGTRTTMQRPFANLVGGKGFGRQLREVAQTLRDALYDRRNTRTTGPLQLAPGNPLRTLYALAGVPEVRAGALADVGFNAVHRRLFGMTAQPASPTAREAPLAALPPVDLLQFPYPLDEKWFIGSAHTNTGTGRFPLSSLDMHKGGFWDGDLSSHRVTASAAGTFKRHSSCFAEIVHSDGWSTTYYHLMNIELTTGATVMANDPIGNPANTERGALCEGGHSTGPHQHWSLKYNGSLHHLHGVTVSGYQIHATGVSYDKSCTHFNLSREGATVCAGWHVNPGVDAP